MSAALSGRPQLPLFDGAVDPQDLVRGRPELFRPGFAAWLADNGHIWRAFERETERIWSRGRRHYSARTIVEVLRHESALAEVGGQWKINDRHTPDLSRLYGLAHPDRADLFERRVMPGAERVA